jgi:polysaccharide deacetylase family protein (PEP-CTERM system associated)
VVAVRDCFKTNRNHMERRARPPELDSSVSASDIAACSIAESPRPSNGKGSCAHSHVLTVALEDYYHAAPFRPWIREEIWYRFEDRLAGSTRRMLDLFDRCEVRATFFVTGRIAEAAPDLVREVAARGHEIAAAGDHGWDLQDLDRARFREEVIQARERLERIVGRQVVGYRVASAWLSPADVWILDVLADAGYRYDSSIRPALLSNADKVWRRLRKHERDSNQAFDEMPVSSIGLFGLRVPIAGGGPFRHFPEYLTKRAVAHWDRHRSEPYVLHLRTWELDTDQPRISAPPLYARIRHYRNLRRMPRLLEEVLSAYRFTSVAEHLTLRPAPLSFATAPDAEPGAQPQKLAASEPDSVGTAALVARQERKRVSVVIPCYNETQSLPYLSKTIQSLIGSLAGEYAFTFMFVDDCSTDATWTMLAKLFGGRPGFILLRHARNQGVSAAIQTGIRNSKDDIVCSIDCDCTYDPHELGRMIPLLTDGVDVVTASPYHPAGRVRNVPAWRLFLSKTLSRLYRLVLRQQLFTYTSCFRVYRKETVGVVNIRLPGFLGLAEMIARMDLAGRRVVEYPTTLEVRVLGFSKMKVLRNIVGHLGFLAGLVGGRVLRRNGAIVTEPRF